MLPARRRGFAGNSHGGEKRRSERKVAMLPGAPHKRQTLHKRGGGEEEEEVEVEQEEVWGRTFECGSKR